MNQAALVRRRQAERHLAADAQYVQERQSAFALQPIVECLALQQRHRQERDAALLADLPDGNDVIVIQRRRCTRLAQESLAADRHGGNVRPHHL
jgi:hypothetical protein